MRSARGRSRERVPGLGGRTSIIGRNVYKAIKAFADTNPSSAARRKSFSTKRLRDDSPCGWNCPPEQRKEVEELRKELSKLGKFRHNSVKSQRYGFSSAKTILDGLPESFFASTASKLATTSTQSMAKVTWHSTRAGKNAKSEGLAKSCPAFANTLAKDKNVPSSEPKRRSETRSRCASVISHGTITRRKSKWPRRRDAEKTSTIWSRIQQNSTVVSKCTSENPYSRSPYDRSCLGFRFALDRAPERRGRVCCVFGFQSSIGCKNAHICASKLLRCL